MKPKIIITGSSGFIGKYFKSKLSDEFKIVDYSLRYKKYQSLILESHSVIHMAGIAHDLKGKYSYEDYYESNYKLTKQVFDAFLNSSSKIFIYFSSVKAVEDSFNSVITESISPNPKTFYGKTKLLSEKYILSKTVSNSKKVFILRPCMVHGPNNIGNLNLLFNMSKLGFPWPLAKYKNKRSFCSIDNLLFVVKELLINKNIKSDIFNVADDKSISTNDLIKLIFKFLNKKPRLWKVPRFLINKLVFFGDYLKLPLNSETFDKLTKSYEVSNDKIKNKLSIKLMPVSIKRGLLKTFKSF